MQVVQLFYVSRAVAPCDTRTVQSILNQSRRNNWRQGVTGCLLFSGRCFAQVLEGDERTIAVALERIERDPRHTGVRLVARRGVKERAYADWSMAYVHALNLEDDLERLLVGDRPDDRSVADVMKRMQPDTVVGPLS